jgi:hypothetical protein
MFSLDSPLYYDMKREKLLQQIGYTWQQKGEL